MKINSSSKKGVVRPKAQAPSVSQKSSPKDPNLLSFIQAQKYRSEIYLPEKQGEKYIKWLKEKTTFEEIADLFNSETLENCFGKNTNKILPMALSDLLHVHDNHHSCSKELFEKKLQLFRTIISNTLEEKNSQVFFPTINTIVSGIFSKDLSGEESKRLSLEFERIIDPKNYFLNGHSAMMVMGDLLASRYTTNTLPFAIDFFHSDSHQELLREIFISAYDENPETAKSLYETIMSTLECRDLSGLYTPQQIKYSEAMQKIKKINAETSCGISNKLVDQTPQPVTVKLLSVKNDSASDSESKALVSTGELHSLVQYLQDCKIKNPEISIDTNGYLPTYKDMVEGLLTMLKVIPETSPLRFKIENFLDEMPIYIKNYPPETVKKELLTLLKPFFPRRRFNLINILGVESPSFKKAYSEVEQKFRKLFFEDRMQLPRLENFLIDDSVFETKMDDESCHTQATLGFYETGSESFKYIADIFCKRYSANGVPLHEYIVNVLKHYEKVIKTKEPNFNINLESTHNYMGKIKSFKRFLNEVCIQQPKFKDAASFLRSACDKYINFQLNDQTFISKIEELCLYCRESSHLGPHVARQMMELVDVFVHDGREEF